MECKFCGSKWDSSVKISNCPFCGKMLIDESVTNIPMVITKLISQYGLEILKDGRLIYSYVCDYVVNEERDKKLLKIATAAGILQEVYRIALSESEEEQISLKLKAIKLLEDESFFSYENAEHIINILLVGCGIDITDNKSNEKIEPVQIESIDSLDEISPYYDYNELYADARKGDALAQYLVGLCYKRGVIVEKSIDDAIAWFSFSGLDIAQYEMAGLWCYDKNATDEEKKRAAELLQSASDGGHIWAQNALSNCYRTGNGVEKSIKRHLELLQLSSKPQTDDRSYSICTDYVKAAKLTEKITELHKLVDDFAKKYKRDIENGDCFSIWSMAHYYQKGEYFQQDLKKAFEYFKYCADTGDYKAQFEVAYCYENGLGVDKNYLEAETWYELAEKSNSYMKREDFKTFMKKV